jgi:exonuclease SbcC
MVRVETDDGHTIEWRRKTSPSYLIDGQQFDRLRSGGLPDELHQALRLSKVDAGNEADFDVHFGMQKAPIFLLGSSAANAARFFASSSDAIRLVQVQKRHKEKHSDAQREKNRLESESRQLNAELAELEPVVDVDHRLTALEEIYDRLTVDVLWLETAEKRVAELEGKSAALAWQSRLAEAFAGLTAPPQLVATDPLENLILAIETAERKQTVAQWRADALQTLPAPPPMHDIERFEALVESFDAVSVGVARGKAEQTALTQLIAPPQLADADRLDRLIERFAAIECSFASEQSEHAALDSLVQPPELVDVTRLAKLLGALAQTAAHVDHWQGEVGALGDFDAPPVETQTSACEELLSQLSRAQSNVDTLTGELATATAELSAAADALRSATAEAVCSVCGAELDADRVIARAAAGLGGHDHA